MNPLQKILTAVFNVFNKLIGGISSSTADSIKKGFFALIFFLCIGGMILGYNRGKDAALIKSPPLVNSTNEVFELDAMKEMDEGDFSSMLESEKINEMKSTEPAKAKYPSRENLEPEIDRAIVEPEKDKKIKPAPGLEVEERLFEQDETGKKTEKSDVRLLKRDAKPVDKEEIVPEKTDKLEKKDTEDAGTSEGKTGRGKKGIIRTQKKEPALIEKEPGIIQK